MKPTKTKPRDNLNKRTGTANPRKPAAAKGKSNFGALGAAASAKSSPMLNSPYGMQGMP